MAKNPDKGKCVHCLTDPVDRNWDHMFPKSWYPDTTPENLEKWQIPSCIACNARYGKLMAPAEEALKLQRPPPDGALKVVLTGAKKDEAV